MTIPAHWDGKGLSELDPRLIHSVDDFVALYQYPVRDVNGNYGIGDRDGFHYRITANLDFQGTTLPQICSTSGDSHNWVRLDLDGGGYTISNLTVVTNTATTVGNISTGLFSRKSNGYIRNLRVSNLIVSNAAAKNPAYCGTLAGYLSATSVSDVHIENATIGSERGISYVGGFAAYMVDSTVTRCSVTSATYTRTASLSNCGGFASYMATSTAVNCYADSVHISGAYNFGGFCRSLSNGSTLTNCAAVRGSAGVNSFVDVISPNNNSDRVRNCFAATAGGGSRAFIQNPSYQDDGQMVNCFIDGEWGGTPITKTTLGVTNLTTDECKSAAPDAAIRGLESGIGTGQWVFTDGEYPLPVVGGMQSYTLSYDANGGEGAPADNIGYERQLVSGPGTMYRIGFVFSTWNTAADGSGTAYGAASVIELTEDTTLFAIWVPDTSVPPQKEILLQDPSGVPFTTLREFTALIETERMFELSTVRFLADVRDYPVVSQARYCSFDGRAYRIESTILRDNPPSLEVLGSGAEVDLSLRTVEGTLNGSGTSGAFVAQIIGSFTGDRALNVQAGDLAHGTTSSRQVGWGDAYEVCRDILAGDGLGLCCKYRDRGLYLDAIVPSTASDLTQRQTGAASVTADDRIWRNYAIVIADGTRVDVDFSGSAERRELYVDGSSVKQGELTTEQYEQALYALGVEALADARKVESVEAQAEEARNLGDVVWYDGDIKGWLMVTERTLTTENGGTVVALTLGEPPLTFKEMSR